MEHSSNGHRLVVRKHITTCKGLDGQHVAIQSESAAGTALLRDYFAEECPEVRLQTLFIPQSQNRAAALLSGQLDAAVLELSLFLWLDQQAPGQFRVLEDFGARWPLLKVTGVYVNSDFAREHPEVVRDYLRARVWANRAVTADPSLLVAEATRRMGASPEWPGIVKAYLGMTAWAPNGGLTEVDVERSLAFFKRVGLKTELTASDVSDLSFLQSVVAESDSASPNGATKGLQ